MGLVISLNCSPCPANKVVLTKFVYSAFVGLLCTMEFTKTLPAHNEGGLRTGMIAKKGNHGVNNYQSFKLQNDCSGTCWRLFALGFCSSRYFITVVDLYGMNVGK